MGEEIDMAYSDRELLARLIECEAGGEGENGMKAVASVVMNRVRSTGGEYARVGQGSIRKIIFQPGQFEGSKPRQLLITKEQWQELKMKGAYGATPPETEELPPPDEEN